MADWTALSEDGRNDIKAKLMGGLNSLGIKGAVARWIKPPQLPHWQLIIETSWCNNKSRHDTYRALEQAMARAARLSDMGASATKAGSQTYEAESGKPS
jgi:hypothetical protein